MSVFGSRQGAHFSPKRGAKLSLNREWGSSPTCSLNPPLPTTVLLSYKERSKLLSNHYFMNLEPLVAGQQNDTFRVCFDTTGLVELSVNSWSVFNRSQVVQIELPCISVS